MSKMGRPKSDKPRTKKIDTTLSEEEYAEFMKYCEKEKQKKAKVIREAVLDFIGK